MFVGCSSGGKREGLRETFIAQGEGDYVMIVLEFESYSNQFK